MHALHASIWGINELTAADVVEAAAEAAGPRSVVEAGHGDAGGAATET